MAPAAAVRRRQDPAKLFLNVASLNPSAPGKPVILWRNPTVGYRRAGAPGRGQSPGGQITAVTPAADQALPPLLLRVPARSRRTCAASDSPPDPRVPLRTAVTEETARKLGFGKSPDGSQIGPDDFASEGSINFEVPLPQGVVAIDFQVDAAIGADRDQVFRITIGDREEGPRGIPTRAFVGDPQSAGYRKFKAGVLEFATILPPNSNIEPTPADKDPGSRALRQHLQHSGARRLCQRREVYPRRPVRGREHAGRSHPRAARKCLDRPALLLRIPRQLPAAACRALQVGPQGQTHVGARAGRDRRAARRSAQIHRAPACRVRRHACRRSRGPAAPPVRLPPFRRRCLAPSALRKGEAEPALVLRQGDHFRGRSRQGHTRSADPHSGLAGVPLPGRTARGGSGRQAPHRLGYGQPPELLPLVLHPR